MVGWTKAVYTQNLSKNNVGEGGIKKTNIELGARVLKLSPIFEKGGWGGDSGECFMSHSEFDFKLVWRIMLHPVLTISLEDVKQK